MKSLIHYRKSIWTILKREQNYCKNSVSARLLSCNACPRNKQRKLTESRLSVQQSNLSGHMRRFK